MPVSGGISQVTVWLPIKNETRLLNYRLALLVCRSPLSLSLNLFITPTHTHSTCLFIFLSISLTHTLRIPPSFPWLTAIRHWPCSLCLLPLPQVQPSHNYFLWFTVVGHCHPPKVFTAEITHTHGVFPPTRPTSIVPLSFTLSRGSCEGGLNYKSRHPERTGSKVFLNG